MTVLELFAGAGGWASGFHAAGLHHVGLVERDRYAAATLRAASLGPVIEADANGLDLSAFRGVDLLAAGFPCQPFSSAGERLGAADERDGWPSTLAAIDATQPAGVLLENVPGLTQHSREECGSARTCPGCYVAVITAALRERYAVVEWRILCAADYGVPQRRYRVFVWAGAAPFPWPEPTHSEMALALAKWRGGDYWRALGMDAAGAPSAREARLLAAWDASSLFRPAEGALLPWRTVRQALDLGAAAEDLGGGSNPRTAGAEEERSYRLLTDEPCTTIAAEQIGNAGPWLLDPNQRVRGLVQPAHTICAAEAEGGEASTYLLVPHDTAARTGTLDTSVDIPARSLRAQPGCALAIEEWRRPQAYRALHPDQPSTTIHVGNGEHGAPLAPCRRRLTWRECAVLQDFPTDHPFQGSKTRIYHQIGNACPSRFGLVLGDAALRLLRRAA